MRQRIAIALLLLPGLAIAQQAELFHPMPLATLHASEDPTLLALHETPAFTVIGRVNATTQAMRAQTPTLALNLTPELRGEARLTHSETLRDGSIVWQGHWHDVRHWDALREDTDALVRAANEVVLISHEGRISGSVHVDGQLYGIRPLRSGGHAVVAVDTARLPADHPVGWESLATTHATVTPTEARQAGTGDAQVMVLFSDKAMSSLADPVGFALLAIAETNQGYANSGIAHRLSAAAVLPA
ncbi:MAG TPA: hypothetical protein VIM98_15440, partial [Dyella sp.]|uniref:hypothetical protein n=1 Tax=Dyella sp. TaxID=1869338 RepID=UPI002F940CBA